MTTNDKAWHAKNMRYKRPALALLGYDAITDELYEINDACADVQYFMEQGDDTLLNALDGDDEAEWEFRMAFADLSGKVEQLGYALGDSDVREYFDDCTVALIGNRYQTLGFDGMEEDYYALTSFEQGLAHTLSGQRLMRRTKPEMISLVGQCLGIVIAFLDIRHSYDYLKATFDLLRDENTSLLCAIKDIDEAYNAGDAKRLECLLEYLPDRLWLE